jgi:hypothetical protein
MTREEILELVRIWEQKWITKDASASQFRTVVIHAEMSEPLRQAIKTEIESNPEGARPYGVDCGPEVRDFEIESIGADGTSTMIPYHVEIVRAGSH